MNRFDKIAQELGWRRLYNDIGVFISKGEDRDGYLTIAFPAATGYEDFDNNEDRINKQFVSRFIYGICCSNKFKEENKNWVIPMLISDYFAHRYDWDNELVWAKKAMEENTKLTPLQFSVKIREKF